MKTLKWEHNFLYYHKCTKYLQSNRLRRVQQRRHSILRFTIVLFHYCINQKQIHNLPQILLSINHELIERRYFVKLAICWLSHLYLVYNMTNIFRFL